MGPMGNSQEEDIDDDIDVDDSPQKRHKKHKKHKHRKKKEGGEASEEPDTPTHSAIKLKIKIKGKGEGSDGAGTTPPKKLKPPSIDGKKKDVDVFKTKKSDEDTSDEEKEWLKALEAGTLDDNGLVKRDKDPLLMTARQRALVQGKAEETLLELPSGYKNTELTEEQQQRRQQRAKKRREQAQEKREKDKKQTVERLLKKQESKRGAAKASKARAGGGRRGRPPGLRYLLDEDGCSVSVPEGLAFPMAAQRAHPPLPARACGVAGCGQPKKYSCSKTGVPLCSLDCYKRNLAQARAAGTL